MDKNLFIHLHIPKCGGNTIRNLFEKSFGPGTMHTHGVLNDYQYTEAQVTKIISHYPHLKCLTGHKLSLDLPYQLPGINLTPITWVRDPFSLAVSYYFFHRNHTNKDEKAKTLSLEEYLDWALIDGNCPNLMNGQVQFLSPNDGLGKIKDLVRDDKLLLFPLKKINESFYYLHRKYPKDIINYIPKSKNTSTKDQHVPDYLREKYSSYMEKDYELLDIAEEFAQSHLTDYDNAKLGPRDSMKEAIIRNLSRTLYRASRKLMSYTESRPHF